MREEKTKLEAPTRSAGAWPTPALEQRNIVLLRTHFQASSRRVELRAGHRRPLLSEGDQLEVEHAALVPDAMGYLHKLPGCVVIYVRMALVDARFELQWRFPDRQLRVMGGLKSSRMPAIVKAADRVQHRELVLDAGAKAGLRSCCMMFNIMAQLARDVQGLSTASALGSWDSSGRCP